jgi:hypothetical protein
MKLKKKVVKQSAFKVRTGTKAGAGRQIGFGAGAGITAA